MNHALLAVLATIIICLLDRIRHNKKQSFAHRKTIEELSVDRDRWAFVARQERDAMKEMASRLRALQDARIINESELMPAGVRFTFSKYECGFPISVAPPTCSILDSYGTFEAAKEAVLDELRKECVECKKRLDHLKGSNSYQEYAKGFS